MNLYAICFTKTECTLVNIYLVYVEYLRLVEMISYLQQKFDV